MNRLLRPVGIMLMLLLIMVLYFWVHKPFSPAEIFSIGGVLVDLITVTALIVLTGGVGRRALAFLVDDSTLSRTERIALESGLGLGLYSTMVLIVGLLGGYRAPILWGILIVLGLFSFRSVMGWTRDLRTSIHAALTSIPTDSRLFAFAALFVIFTAALFAFAPPVAWDVVVYHLIGPQRYIEAGQITAQPDNYYLGLTQGVEVLYGVLMSAFGRDTATAPLHWWYALVGIMTVSALVKRLTDLRAAWFAVLLPLTSFSVWLLMGKSYIDLSVMAYSALLLIVLLQARENPKNGWFILAGLLIGFAMSIKYPAGVLGVSAALLFIRYPRAVVIMAVVAALTFLPWALRGLLLYGNPIYPLVFGGLNWDATRAALFTPPNTGLLARGEAWQLPIIPIAATVFGIDTRDGYSFTSGEWLLTLPLLLPFVWRTFDDRVKSLVWFCAVFLLPPLLFWMATAAVTSVGMQTRLQTALFPPFIVLGTLGVYGLSRLPKKPVDIYFIFRAIFVFTLALGLLGVLRHTVEYNVIQYHTPGIMSRDEYIGSHPVTGASYRTMQSLKELQDKGEISADAQVRFLWEIKSYYCPPTITCVVDALLDHWRYPIAQGKTPDEIFESWRASGDDYVLLWRTGLEFLRDEREDSFDAALERYMTEVWTDGRQYFLYKWR